MKKHTNMTRTLRDHRTRLADVSPFGRLLSNENLRLVAGGAPRKCLKPGASVMPRGEIDLELYLVDD